MRASTLLSITAALILALGTAIGARALGLFDKKPAVATPEPVIKILAARQNLYEGISITPEMLMIRDLRPGELENYQKNRDKYLPALIEAAALRTPVRNIEADQPILKTDLEDLAFPDGPPLRLAPGTRAVNLSVPKERSAGGLIARGDHVDVLLTSRICDGQDCSKARTLSAFIARNLRVIVKRNQLWTVLKANPEGMPVAYTLEADPYRAALIEFATNKGQITLLVSPASRTQKSTSVVPAATGSRPTSFSIPGSPEYQDEDERVEKLLRGDYSITEADLERIFRLRPVVRTPPPPPPVAIQSIAGVRVAGQSFFDGRTGQQIAPPPASTQKSNEGGSSGPVVSESAPWMGYTFYPPDGASSNGSGKPNCPT